MARRLYILLYRDGNSWCWMLGVGLVDCPRVGTRLGVALIVLGVVIHA